ncbi:hypothetical protein BASA81_017786 [Batrachochytrium salamandrivorans]|nr:hypothetical protein BASA81_017786 [Batrachochytrium salamandrivorans]
MIYFTWILAGLALGLTSPSLQVLSAIPKAEDYPKIDVITPPHPEWSARFLKGELPSRGVGNTMHRDKYECRNPLHWGLTYDDGPSPFSPPLIHYLATYNYKATFFALGGPGSSESQGIHTWSHPHLTQISDEEIISEIYWTAKIIQETIGVVPKLMRPPFGEIDERVQRFKTWANTSTTHGVISLEHDRFQASALQAIGAIDVVAKSRFQAVKISECIGQAQVYDSELMSGTGFVSPAFTLQPLPNSPTTTLISSSATSNSSVTHTSSVGNSAMSSSSASATLVAGSMVTPTFNKPDISTRSAGVAHTRYSNVRLFMASQQPTGRTSGRVNAISSNISSTNQHVLLSGRSTGGGSNEGGLFDCSGSSLLAQFLAGKLASPLLPATASLIWAECFSWDTVEYISPLPQFKLTWELMFLHSYRMKRTVAEFPMLGIVDGSITGLSLRLRAMSMLEETVVMIAHITQDPLTKAGELFHSHLQRIYGKIPTDLPAQRLYSSLLLA